MNLKPLVNNYDLWESYKENLEEERKRLWNLMIHCKDPQELLRLQGEARFVENRFRLRDKVLANEPK